MYHRFALRGTEREFSQNEFVEQMMLLKERCEIVTLAELCSFRRSRSSRPLAAVTIDDGYEDCYSVAYPVLRDLGLRATVFVTTGFIAGELHLWPDRMHALLEKCSSATVELRGFWGRTKVSFENREERELAWHRLADQLVFTSNQTRQQALHDLEESLGVSIDEHDMAPYRAMTWDHLRELHSAGFEIGCHSYSHAYLAGLLEKNLHKELAESRDSIESALGARVRSFAYPNGAQRDYTLALASSLHQLGYDQAVLAVPAPFSPTERYGIGRLSGACSIDNFRNLVDGFGALSSSRRSRSNASGVGKKVPD